MLIQGKGKVNIVWSQVPVRVPCAHVSARALSLDGPEPTGRQPEETGAQGGQHCQGCQVLQNQKCSLDDVGPLRQWGMVSSRQKPQ